MEDFEEITDEELLLSMEQWRSMAESLHEYEERDAECDRLRARIEAAKRREAA